ncbi:hypothetical protein RhiirA5_419745 [Rhizophagus irregularis]|uniref:Protein FAR1-RELATED SEQUENCE n=1 Tax=Rhizophagus irregularis TaxID=588596 RepID=A0A2N0PHK7_9GLOM|nr:hypothetical protein RhiirA5_419745 [Rhizophagus irregularis]
MVATASSTWTTTKHHFYLKWAALLQKYDDAANYLHRYLYKCREAWALCFTHCAFNAGMQSTQRVESYNGIIQY